VGAAIHLQISFAANYLAADRPECQLVRPRCHRSERRRTSGFQRLVLKELVVEQLRARSTHCLGAHKVEVAA